MKKDTFDKSGYWVEKECPMCGKKFLIVDINTYAYKRTVTSQYGNPITGYFCKYSCMTKYDRENKRKNYFVNR